MPKDDALARRLQPPARSLHAFKTEKHMIMLSLRAASAFRAIADDVFGKGIECSLDGGIEEAMNQWHRRAPRQLRTYHLGKNRSGILEVAQRRNTAKGRA